MNKTGKFISRHLVCMLLAVSAPVVAAGAPGDLQFQRAGEGEEISAGSFPPAFFPHWVHRVRYRCDACHDSLFEMKVGDAVVSMASHAGGAAVAEGQAGGAAVAEGQAGGAAVAEGQACGACHNGNQAFDDSFENCARCHRPPPD